MNFIEVDFDEFFGLVVPIIASRAWSIGEVHKLWGRPMRLFPQQHLFDFLLYMKCDNVTSYDAFQWYP